MGKVVGAAVVAVFSYLAAAVAVATWLPKVYARHRQLTSVQVEDV